MKKRGFTLVEIMIVIAIVAVLGSIAVLRILPHKITANDTFVKANLKAMSRALEAYSAFNQGTFPTDMSTLTEATPPYIAYNFCGVTTAGFTYTCTLEASGYTIAADPSTVGVSGSQQFSISTGGAFN